MRKVLKIGISRRRAGAKARLFSCSPRVQGGIVFADPIICQHEASSGPATRGHHAIARAGGALDGAVTTGPLNDPLYDAGADAQGPADLQDAHALGSEPANV